MNARDKSYPWSLAAALRDPAEAAAFLDAAIEMDEPSAPLLALRQIAEAHGMAEVARRAKVSERTLLEMLSENGSPTITTVYKVLRAVGLKMRVTPAWRPFG